MTRKQRMFIEAMTKLNSQMTCAYIRFSFEGPAIFPRRQRVCRHDASAKRRGGLAGHERNSQSYRTPASWHQDESESHFTLTSWVDDLTGGYAFIISTRIKEALAERPSGG